MSKTTREWHIDSLRKATNSLEAYIVELEKKADETTGKILPVEYVGNVFGSMKYKIEDYGRSSWGLGVNSEVAIRKATEDLENKWGDVQEKHKQNLVAIKNNQQLFDKICLIMQNIGIPKSRNILKGKKYVPESAGYLDDLRRYAKRDDGFLEAEKSYRDYLEKIKLYKIELEKQKVKAEEEKVKELEKKKEERTLAVMLLKYGLPINADWNDVLEHVISQNKYLRLAYWLERNRGDWNDGYYFAETGLDGFEVENPIDKEIYNDISDCITNWYGDGRIFRDTEWNYNKIYELVENKELVQDLKIVLTKTY